MRKRNLILIALVFTLIICATIQPAIAYFTTFVTAKGGYVIKLGDTTKVKETFSNWTKAVTISKDKDSEPVFIRAKVRYEGKYTIDVSGDGWTVEQGDGYYYYGSSAADTDLTALEASKDTTPLKVEIKDVPVAVNEDGTENQDYKQLKDGESFSVVVVYESTPVRYHDDGTAYADWDAKLVEIGSTSGGNG